MGLALTRRENESVRIGQDIMVTVVRIDRDRVRLLFSAPREVDIVRTELLTGKPDAAKGGEL